MMPLSKKRNAERMREIRLHKAKSSPQEIKAIQPKRLYPTDEEQRKVKEFEKQHPDKCLNKADLIIDWYEIELDADGQRIWEE